MIEEFAKNLVQHVRDEAIRECDLELRPNARSETARRWRELDVTSSDLRVVIADVVDVAIANLLLAIEEGFLRLKYVSDSGREVDLTKEGSGEMCGNYMGTGGWRALYSNERFVDDCAEPPPDW